MGCGISAKIISLRNSSKFKNLYDGHEFEALKVEPVSCASSLVTVEAIECNIENPKSVSTEDKSTYCTNTLEYDQSAKLIRIGTFPQSSPQQNINLTLNNRELQSDSFNDFQTTIIENACFEDAENLNCRVELPPLPEESDEEKVNESTTHSLNSEYSDGTELIESNSQTAVSALRKQSPQNDESADYSDIVNIELEEGLQLIIEPAPLEIQSCHKLVTFEVLKAYQEEYAGDLSVETVEEYKALPAPSYNLKSFEEVSVKEDAMLGISVPEIIQTESLQSMEDEEDLTMKEISSSLGLVRKRTNMQLIACSKEQENLAPIISSFISSIIKTSQELLERAEGTQSYSSVSVKTAPTEKMSISAESNTRSSTTTSTTVAMTTSQTNLDEDITTTTTTRNRNANENLTTHISDDDNLINRKRHIMVK